MIYNKHLDLEGKHALLSPSSYHWLNYDNDDVFRKYASHYASLIGTVVHSIAEDRIKHSLRINKDERNGVLCELLKNNVPLNVIDIDRIMDTLTLYVNDAVKTKMTSEVRLYYSDNCFGTTDSIRYDDRKHKLHIYDLKTGETPAHVEQLEIYAALFCLEYGVNPNDISIELRLYQNGECTIYEPDSVSILEVMATIQDIDSQLQSLKLSSL